MPAGTDLSGVVLEGRYKIVERMAEGAMGVVYRGLRTRLNRPVAIKVMHAALPGAMAARERFEREAKLMALLEHPHCVSVIDYGLHGDKPYVVMELVRGRSLHELIVEQGRFDIPRAADIMRQVLSGLSHAHEQGIIHRDVKPANIMITPKAPLGVHARILDFGLARLCAANTTSLSDGMAVGTPSYMAPEQCRGDRLDERVDLYACGIVLFELVTGRKPFVADDPIQTIKMHIEKPAPRLADITAGDYGELEDVVARALAKSPADRFPNAVAMAAAIEAATPASKGRSAADQTSAIREEELTSGDLEPVTSPSPSSIQVPITIDSAVFGVRSEAKTGIHDPHDSSVVRRMLPHSRLRWFVFACVVLLGAAAYASYVLFFVQDESAPPAIQPSTEPAAAPVEPGVIAPAHPRGALVAFDDGKAYFAKFWWTDGIKAFRQAIAVDPTYRSDPELLKIVVRGFATTPYYDDRLGSFLIWIGAPAIPYVEELAKGHPNPQIRARASAMVGRLH
jgi:serine/threonine-protein kinase